MTYQPETLALHGGFRADPATAAVAPPIYFTSSYLFESSEYARRLFYLEEIGYTYTRTSSPSREVLERRVAALEGGKAALALASGAAASTNALLSLVQGGDNVVLAAEVAQGRNAALVTTLRRLNIEVRLADSPGRFTVLTDSRTRAWYAESLNVPSLRRFPIGEVAARGRALGVPLIVDNTALPLTCRPFDDGAAVVVYSATEFLGGHGTTNGGLIVDGGNFSWDNGRLPTLSEPNPSYHGTVWTEVVKKWNASPLIAHTRGGLLRDFGAAISPMNVFQLVQGVETLPLRVRTHNANAARVATFLEGHKAVANLSVGGALVAFDVADGARFTDALELFIHAAEYGDARSTVVAPAPAPNRVLLSVGLEHPDDIIADLEQALAKSA